MGALRALLVFLAIAISGPDSVPVESIPPDSARPEVVLEAYLRSLVRGDCDATHRLETPHFVAGDGGLCGEVVVTSFRVDPGRLVYSASEVALETHLTMHGGDGSFPDGEIYWVYQLVRQADGAWRIAGEGTG